MTNEWIDVLLHMPIEKRSVLVNINGQLKKALLVAVYSGGKLLLTSMNRYSSWIEDTENVYPNM